MSFRQIKLKITPKQQKQAIQGKAMRLTQSCIGEGQLCMIHPLNYKKLVNAKGGVNLTLSPGEIMASANHHGLAGSGFFDDVWSGIKTAGKWLKDSGVGTQIANALQAPLAGVIGAPGALLARQAVKSFAGVGIKKKKGKKAISASGLYL